MELTTEERILLVTKLKQAITEVLKEKNINPISLEQDDNISFVARLATNILNSLLKE